MQQACNDSAIGAISAILAIRIINNLPVLSQVGQFDSDPRFQQNKLKPL